jgi:hypothetical protein
MTVTVSGGQTYVSLNGTVIDTTVFGTEEMFSGGTGTQRSR